MFKWPRDLRSGKSIESGPKSSQLLSVLVEHNAVQSTLPSLVAPARHIEIVIADAVVRVSAGTDAACSPQPANMIGLPVDTGIWLAAGVTDMRAGMNGLAARGEMALTEDPYCGHVFVFRSRRGDMYKVLWWSDDGLCLLAKRLERSRFVWPQANKQRQLNCTLTTRRCRYSRQAMENRDCAPLDLCAGRLASR